jgi:hypothetical protein
VDKANPFALSSLDLGAAGILLRIRAKNSGGTGEITVKI